MPSPFKDKERESEGRDDKKTILTPSSFDPLFRGCLKFEPSHENLETMVLTQELGEPLRLVVVFHCHSAGVEEDEGDDEPEPVGRLANSSYEKPKVLLFLPRLLVSLRFVSCGGRYTHV